MFTIQKKLTGAELIRQKYSLDAELNSAKLQFDEDIKENFIARRKMTVVCGPCSADNPRAMHEYLCKLSAVQANYPNLLIVARVYSTKPHSNGRGYKGTLFHECVEDNVDMEQGIIRTRQIMIDCIKLGLPVADELLYPELYPYFADLVSYWFIGARSSEDTLHRSFASGLDVCCGVKNSTDGDILKAADSLYAIANPCVFLFDGSQIATSGCKFAHVVLRGGKLDDEFRTNISPEHTRNAKERLRALGMNDFIMADLSHANSNKVAINQIENARHVAQNSDISGVMIESYLHSGVSNNSFGVSKTDDCLSLDDTIRVLDIISNSRKY